MRPMILATLLLATTLSAAPAPAPLQAVPAVDLARYLGTWHEVARYPNFFQNGCSHSRAQYSLQADGSIAVLNTCSQADGKEKQVLGRADVVDRTSNAKLKVSFVPAWMRWTGLGRGDYWVVDLAPDYSCAVVSEPSRKYLWILNREPQMQPQAYEKLMEKLKALGFDPARLIRS